MYSPEGESEEDCEWKSSSDCAMSLRETVSSG